MAYATISNWTANEWNDDMESLARDKYVPLVMSVGASSVRMVRTGELTFSVITEYADQAAAEAAQARIADIRAQAAEEMPMAMDGVSGGQVFASG